MQHAVGDWQDHWDQLQQTLERLESADAAGKAGSASARDDLATLFEESDSLRDRTKQAIGPAKPHSVDLGMKRSVPLSLAYSMKSAGFQTAVEQPNGSTAAHSWTVSYTVPGASKITVDGLALARDVVEEWKLLLGHLGLI